MRGLACFLLIASTAAPARAAATGGTVAVWWQPPGEVPPAARARAAFAAAAAERGAPLIDAVEPARHEPPLAPALDAALADYAAFRFSEALAKLDELARLADARGGGELDQRRLSEIYLYRGLARLEVGPAEAAWDDLVRAARLDPTRVIDPARFAPRVVAAYRRAVAEASQLPRAELELVVPEGAVVRFDGRVLAGGGTVAVGPHLVTVAAEGYEPWSGVVAVDGAHERFQPSLRRQEPPDADRLLALTRDRAPARILAGAVVRVGAGWRFVARELTPADGKIVSGSADLAEGPVAIAVERVVARLMPAEAPSAAAKPLYRRWWVWAAAGGVAAALAVVIPISVVYGTSSPQVGGAVGPLR
ncbi:MAG: hypothetical protein ACXVDD_07330 [Polyangia bacterium]